MDREIEVLRQYSSNKVADWQVLIATCKLTPRLQEQVQSAIQKCHDIANQQNLDVAEPGRNLLALSNKVEDHWRLIYGESSTTARIFGHMLIFETFLHRKLLEDYVGTPYVVNENIVCLGRVKSTLKDQERAASELGTPLNQLEDIYRQRVILVLDELMLDRAHVESKMRAALARRGRSGSDIQPLIDRGDWTSLAAVVWEDQLLTTILFSKDNYTRRVIQRGINRVQKKYFHELVDPSTFVISKYASKLSVSPGLASTRLATAPPPYADLSGEDESNWPVGGGNGQEKTPETGSRKSIKGIFSKASAFSYFKNF